MLDAYGQTQFGIADILGGHRGTHSELLGWTQMNVLIGSLPRVDFGAFATTPKTTHRNPCSLSRLRSSALTPAASAIRYCLGQDLRMRLLEWLPASRTTGNNGLIEYAAAIGSAGVKPFLIGHSLGGTLATVFGALAPDSIRGLVLLGAPLCFRPATSRFRDALVFLVPLGLGEAEPCPGSLLSHFSALASPDTFIWSRLTDAAFSVTDRHAMEIHARVERWALDEIAVPGKLVHQLIEWLYRENLFCQGALKINGALIGPQSVSVPTLEVINTADEFATLGSVKPFIDTMPAGDAHIIEYPGEIGVCLQHLGILIGRGAHAQVWPEIISWIDSHR